MVHAAEWAEFENGAQEGESDSCRSGDTEKYECDTDGGDLADESDEDEDSELDEKMVADAADLRLQEEAKLPPKGFVVVRSDKGRMRRLHYVGACYRVPDEHYFDYTVYGDSLPEAHEVDARCKQCFREDSAIGKKLVKKADEVSSADEPDTSSQSDSGLETARTPSPPGIRPVEAYAAQTRTSLSSPLALSTSSSSSSSSSSRTAAPCSRSSRPTR